MSERFDTYRDLLKELAQAKEAALKLASSFGRAASQLNMSRWNEVQIINLEGGETSAHPGKTPFPMNAAEWPPPAKEAAAILNRYHAARNAVNAVYQQFTAEELLAVKPPDF